MDRSEKALCEIPEAKRGFLLFSVIDVIVESLSACFGGRVGRGIALASCLDDGAALCCSGTLAGSGGLSCSMCCDTSSSSPSLITRLPRQISPSSEFVVSSDVLLNSSVMAVVGVSGGEACPFSACMKSDEGLSIGDGRA